jgi:hypothetical protein
MTLGVVAALAVAATVVPQSLEQLTDRATVVVRATVASQESARAPGPAGIYTFTELRVVETLKGSAPEVVRVRQAGGTVGRETVQLSGDASLAPGEDVLVFLSCRPEQTTCAVVALAQGKFHLQGATDGSVQASRDFAQTEFVHGDPPSAGPERYAALAQRIRARAGAMR